MPTVFISYRRDDTAGEAGRLADDLSEKFGRSRVFIDVDSIPLATNFEDRIHAALDSCRVVFVLIGDQWLTARLPSGERRLDAEDDYLRQEVAAALTRDDVAVVPVLVEGAEMPSAEDLPPDISTLAKINAVDLSHKRWRADVGTLAAIAQRYDAWWSRILTWLRARAIRTALILVLGVAIVAAAIVAGGDVFDGSSEPPPDDPPVRLRTSELETATNARYGFSFQYPVTWERNDPVNGDGLAAIGPEPGLEVFGYGSLPTPGPSPADTFDRLEYLMRETVDATGARVVDGPTQQNVSQFLPEGETSQLAGSRFITETSAANGEPAMTSVVLVTTTRERDVTMQCQVPTVLYSRYRGACNQLISTLTLTN
jgi:hypothetical protein